MRSDILGLLMAEVATRLNVSESDKELMEAFLRCGSTPQKVVFRIRIVLGAAAGVANRKLARDLSTTKTSVLKWRGRYAEQGIEGILEDAPRSGRKKTISADQEAAIVEATLQTKPAQAKGWAFTEISLCPKARMMPVI